MTDRPALGEVFETSRVGTVVARTTDGSRVAGLIRGFTPDSVTARWRSWLAGSALGDVISAIQLWLGTLIAGAWILHIGRMIGRWTRASALYRWLTAEPEPAVIVIDLRETITVRPFLIALDESIGLLVLGQRTSIVTAVVVGLVDRLRDAPVRVLSFLLAVGIVVSTAIGLVTGTLGAVGLWVRVVFAGLAVAGTRVDHSWETIRDSRPVQVAIALLEPPEPPEPPEPAERDRQPTDREE